MPKKKKEIHNLFSSKIAQKKNRRKNAANDGVRLPESVDNFRNNIPLFGPHKIKRLESPPFQRKISHLEGVPTVNAKTGKEIKKLIHKPNPSVSTADPASGAIEQKPSDKPKRGRKSKSRRGTK